MPVLSAGTNPIIVDTGNPYGSTNVNYEKEKSEVLWEREPNRSWKSLDHHELLVRTGLDEPDNRGQIQIPNPLKPGQIYEAAVFAEGQGPDSSDPHLLTDLKVFCLWKIPQERDLITDAPPGVSGGTWHAREIHTKVPTSIALIGATRRTPTRDSNGIPQLWSAEGELAAPLTVSDNHRVELRKLLAGNHYFFVVLVADSSGNWDLRISEFETLRRKLTVQFPTIHIYNDGDPSSSSTGKFWFRVYCRDPLTEQSTTLQEFYLPSQEIDDWSETDRPYPVGFAYISPPTVVTRETATVVVASRGIDEDGFLEGNEAAQSLPDAGVLPLPTGQGEETVTDNQFRMDCPIASTGDDFHYGVDVRWSVEYVP